MSAGARRLTDEVRALSYALTHFQTSPKAKLFIHH